jgi:hypothetical protein
MGRKLGAGIVVTAGLIGAGGCASTARPMLFHRNNQAEPCLSATGMPCGDGPILGEMPGTMMPGTMMPGTMMPGNAMPPEAGMMPGQPYPPGTVTIPAPGMAPATPGQPPASPPVGPVPRTAPAPQTNPARLPGKQNS